MSTRVRRGDPSMGTGFSSQRGKVVLDIDINTPPCENLNEVGTSSCGLVHPEAESQQVAPLQPITIDVDALDDDVILCSPRAFAEVYFYFQCSLIVCILPIVVLNYLTKSCLVCSIFQF